MSLLNAWIFPSEAVIAVDTDGARENGSRFGTSKVLPIPHLGGAAIAVRGQAALLQFLFLRAIGSGFDTFDELVSLPTELLDDMTASIPSNLLAAAPHVSMGNMVAMVGWSERRGAMYGRQFVQRGATEAFVADDFTVMLTPWPPAFQDLPKTPEAVEAIAHAQCHWMRDTYPGAMCGGKLVLCRVTRAGIEVVRRELDVEQFLQTEAA